MSKDIRRREFLILAAAALAGHQAVAKTAFCRTGSRRGSCERLLQRWRLRKFPGPGILCHPQR
jgi:hypothetical protein